MPEYQHKSIGKIIEIFGRHKDTMPDIAGSTMLWKALAPSVPYLLQAFDSEPGLFKWVRMVVLEIAEAMREEVEEE